MKRSLPIILFLAIIVSACSGAETPATTATLPNPEMNLQEATETPLPSPTPDILEVIDALGRTVSISGELQRVISFSAPITSSFFALELESLLVGRDSLSTFPEGAEDIPSLGDKFEDLDTVQFQSFNADLVVADTSFPEENVYAIQQMGIPVFVFPIATSLDDIFSNLSLIGSLVGQDDQVDSHIQELDLRLSAVELTLQDVQDTPYIFYELEASDPTQPWTYGAGTILDEMFAAAGAQNAANSLTGTWVQLPLETLQSVDPAIILLADAAYGVSPETVANRPGWGALSAVTSGNVIAFDEGIISQPGPRVIDAIEDLAALVHPDLFP